MAGLHLMRPLGEANLETEGGWWALGRKGMLGGDRGSVWGDERSWRWWRGCLIPLSWTVNS